MHLQETRMTPGQARHDTVLPTITSRSKMKTPSRTSRNEVKNRSEFACAAQEIICRRRGTKTQLKIRAVALNLGAMNFFREAEIGSYATG